MINFCIDDLTESIVCDKIPFEGHDANNLISTHAVSRSQGFLTEYFVRPPVNISFGFICKIDIAYVIIKLSVGYQRSRYIELFTSCTLGEKKIAGFNNYSNNDIVSFHIYGQDPSPRQLPVGFNSCPFFAPKGLKEVTCLTLKIVNTVGSCTPAIGSIEVLGFPSISVPKDIVNQVKLKWNSFANPEKEPSKSSQISSNFSIEKKVAIVKKLPKTTIIPEEFIDPITCDIMLLPIVLPCGKAIDKRTLEKCRTCCEELGQPFSDPFTGLELTDNHYTVPDFALKARIDKFLIDHSNEDTFKTIPRILGQRPSSSIPCNSKSNAQISFGSTSSEIQLSRMRSGCSSSHFYPEGQPKRARLEDLIEETLRSLPSYVNVPPEPPQPKEHCCEICSSKYSLFKIPCEHLICRPCLTSCRGKLICSTCCKPFKSSDPVRFHSV